MLEAVKKIWQTLWVAQTQDLGWTKLWFILGLTAIFTAINYTFDFDKTYVACRECASSQKFLNHVLFYGVIYLCAVAIIWALDKQPDWIKQGQYWRTVLFCWLVFGVYVSKFYPRDEMVSWFRPELQHWAFKCISNLMRPVTVLWLILLYWYWFDRKHQPFYGFSHKGFSVKPYLLMLIIMVPLVMLFAPTPAFQAAYPRYCPADEPFFTGYPAWVFSLSFELCYGLDFVFVELFFRGLLILAFRNIAPMAAVIFPAVVWYVAIHYEKPLGETIGSFWGGYILSILAWKTGSIYGGILVHLGVAWLMEAMAYIFRSSLV